MVEPKTTRQQKYRALTSRKFERPKLTLEKVHPQTNWLDYEWEVERYKQMVWDHKTA